MKVMQRKDCVLDLDENRCSCIHSNSLTVLTHDMPSVTSMSYIDSPSVHSYREVLVMRQVWV